MLAVYLEKTGRRYNRDWVFRNLDQTFTSGNGYAILGPNGSGKSTLLQMLGGLILPSEGTIRWEWNGKPLDVSEVYRKIAFASPYLELMEEFTLPEQIRFHASVKPFSSYVDPGQIPDMIGLRHATGKIIRNFSSGMKQRVKLGLAFFSDTPLLLLDEPLSNLDENGARLYEELVKNHTAGRLVVVCSNHVKDEYGFCRHQVHLSR